MIVDCHVNLWEPEHLRPLFAAGTAYSRPGAVSPKADPDTVYAAMAKVDKAIVFSLRYGDSAGIDGDDEVTARALRKYPDKFVGFASVDPRRPDYMELLRYAVEQLGLKGVKFGPIYSGVSLLDPRMEPIYRYCVEKTCRSPCIWAQPLPRTRPSSWAGRWRWTRSRAGTATLR